MKSHHRIFPAIVAALAAVICPMFAADADDALRRDLDEIFLDQRLSDAQWGVSVYSLDRDELLFGYNANKLYIPASNEKILTAAAALLRLGPEYRFKTRVLTDGVINEDMLRGNLVLQGFGDPSLSTRMGIQRSVCRVPLVRRSVENNRDQINNRKYFRQCTGA